MARAMRVAWWVAFIGACASAPAVDRGEEATVGPTGAEAGVDPYASTATPILPDAPSDAAPTESATGVDAGPPPRRPRVSSSPGQIECETVVCDLATEICCADTQRSGRCISRDAPNGCESLELLWKYCDEVDDCGAGKVCCYSPRPDPTVYAQNVCRTACEDPELETCLAGGKCSGKQRCKLIDESQYDGYCAK